MQVKNFSRLFSSSTSIKGMTFFKNKATGTKNDKKKQIEMLKKYQKKRKFYLVDTMGRLNLVTTNHLCLSIITNHRFPLENKSLSGHSSFVFIYVIKSRGRRITFSNYLSRFILLVAYSL